jgi:uncharacterized protein YxeA
MKKTLMLILSVVLALGLTVPAFAVHPDIPSESVPLIGKTTIELGGSLRFRGDWRSDNITAGPDSITNFVVLGELAALTPAELDALFIAEGLTPGVDGAGALLNALGFARKTDNKADWDGRVRLWLNAYVTDNTMARIHLETGNSNANDTYQWGCGVNDSSGVYTGGGNCKKDELRVLEAWIKHESSGLLGVPAGVKVGHFPLKLGRGLFLLHTRFGDDAVNPFVKITDNLTVEAVMSKFTEDSSRKSSDDTDAYALLVHYNTDAFNLDGDVTYLLDRNYADTSVNAELWNVGIRGDFKIGGWDIYADGEIQFGDIELSDADPLLDDADFKGYAILVGTNVKLGEFNLNGEFAYGSGQDEDEDDFEMFVTSLSSTKKFTYVYDYRMMTAALSQNTGISNTWYGKIGASMKPTADLSVAADLYYLQAAEEVLDEDDLGFELDANLKYQIDKNFLYFIEGGILFTGDFYDNFDPEDDADDAYVVRHGVTLSF